MAVGPTELILVAVLLVVFFGKGKLSGLMGELAHGIKAFKRGLADDFAGEPAGSVAAVQTQPVPARQSDTHTTH